MNIFVLICQFYILTRRTASCFYEEALTEVTHISKEGIYHMTCITQGDSLATNGGILKFQF